MSRPEWIQIPVLKVSQPIGSFYVGSVQASSLAVIARADVRRIQVRLDGDSDPANVFSYMGIQRPLNPDRVEEIQEYVKTVDACFPNTIIISISSDDIQFDHDSKNVMVRNRENVATIIDGQHRLAGFEPGVPAANFDLLVTIFVDMEIAEQAYLFATINTKQTKINPSLTRDLEEFSKIDTPEKVAHNIARSSNSDPASPWYLQIKMLGVKDQIAGGIITQHAFVTEVVDLIYPAKTYHNAIRSELMKNGNKRAKLESLEVPSAQYPLWSFYVTSQDNVIKQVLDNYFRAVKQVFPEDWVNPERILSKTTGYQALMLQLRKFFKEGLERKTLSFDFFLKVLTVARQRLGERPLTINEFGVGKAAASRLREVMFGIG